MPVRTRDSDRLGRPHPRFPRVSVRCPLGCVSVCLRPFLGGLFTCLCLLGGSLVLGAVAHVSPVSRPFCLAFHGTW